MLRTESSFGKGGNAAAADVRQKRQMLTYAVTRRFKVCRVTVRAYMTESCLFNTNRILCNFCNLS